MLTGWQQTEAKERELPEVFTVVDEETRLPIEHLVMNAVQRDTIIFLSERVLLITKEGRNLPITNSIAPIKDHKGLITGAVLIFQDDTRRRLQEEHNRMLERTQILQLQQEELQQLNQLKDDFLSTVSHELRTPLANIKMAIQVLELTLAQQGELDAETNLNRINQYMNILHDQCNQELNLVNDLLDLQQLEAEARPIEWVSIHLSEWILPEATIFQERIRSREQHLQLLVSPDLPVLVSDLSILTRIFTELLMNACKYTPPGGEITVTVRTHPGNRIQLVVCNTGVEIPIDELTHIFDKFYRIPTSDQWQQGGTGLGLALIKKSVTYLGGSIWAESSAGQTRFIVELPISPPDKLFSI